MKQPVRIQLSRRKGWRMPRNTVKVDRSTKWGNPFIVGRQGDREYCVKLFIYTITGFHCLSCGTACGERQEALMTVLLAEKNAGYPTLRGKNLACWCAPGAPCHADVLLIVANRPEGSKRKFDLDKFMAQYQ